MWLERRASWRNNCACSSGQVRRRQLRLYISPGWQREQCYIMCSTASSEVSHRENKYGEKNHTIKYSNITLISSLRHTSTLKQLYTSDQIPLFAPLARPPHCQQDIGSNSLGEECCPRHMGIYSLSGYKHTWTDPSWTDTMATLHLP